MCVGRWLTTGTDDKSPPHKEHKTEPSALSWLQDGQIFMTEDNRKPWNKVQEDKSKVKKTNFFSLSKELVFILTPCR